MIKETLPGNSGPSPQKQLTSTLRWGESTIRNVMSRSRETVRGLVNDPKGRRFIETESLIERHAALCMLHWSAVTRVNEQHLELIVEGANGFSYIPDFCLTLYSGQKLIIEIKAAENLATDATLRERLTTAAYEFEKQGLLFCVVTESDFNRAYHISNLQLLKRFIDYPTKQLLAAIDSISKDPPTNFGQLVSVAGNSHIALALIAQKYLSANLQYPLGNDTPIICGEIPHEPAYFFGWHPTNDPWQEVEDCKHRR